MTFDFDGGPEWWIAVAVLALVALVALVVAAVAYSSYRGMRRQRDEARSKLDDALEDLAEAQRSLEEARRDRDQARRELEEARVDWQAAIRELTPRLRDQAGKISEVIEGLARWQEDRRKLGLGGGWEMRAEAVMKASQEDRERLQEALANFRRAATNSFGALRRLVDPKGVRGGEDPEKESPPTS
ncbi:MAG: hypothetical protein OXI56_05090 [bacterium]|nr:hypothetical protein [bacterium]MDE0601153.1 hypothetical protein [bacterium]